MSCLHVVTIQVILVANVQLPPAYHWMRPRWAALILDRESALFAVASGVATSTNRRCCSRRTRIACRPPGSRCPCRRCDLSTTAFPVVQSRQVRIAFDDPYTFALIENHPAMMILHVAAEVHLLRLDLTVRRSQCEQVRIRSRMPMCRRPCPRCKRGWCSWQCRSPPSHIATSACRRSRAHRRRRPM